MKKRLMCLFITVVLLFSLLTTGCEKKDDTIYLNVYNWEDYICKDEETNLIAEFEEYYLEKYNKKVVVNYTTFGTCENMYNELQLTKTKSGDGYIYAYDLVCPSDYMIQKMIKEDMLEKFDWSIEKGEEGSLYLFEENGSQFIVDLFEQNNWTDYAVPYMYGTMGFVYNEELLLEKNKEITDESEYYEVGDERHWSFPWQAYSKNLGTIKDSIRDTYILVLGYVFSDELTELADKYANGEISQTEYTDTVVEIFNRVDQETVDKAEKALSELKSNVYGFEVDSGKRDMASGKIGINFAWSGDAVYTLDVAEESGTILKYAVPEEGSNIWFDGWLMPKGVTERGTKLVAQEFVNFLSDQDSAIANMNYIGYSSAVGGEKMYENCLDWYAIFPVLEKDKVLGSYDDDYLYEIDGKEYYSLPFDLLSQEDQDSLKNPDGTYTIPEAVWDDDEENVIGFELNENVNLYVHDVSTLLNTKTYTDKIVVHIYEDDIDRQLMTQYPSSEVVYRCAIMQYFNDEEMKRLNNMWDEVKVSAIPVWFIILIIVIIGCFVLVLGYYKVQKRRNIIKKK